MKINSFISVQFKDRQPVAALYHLATLGSCPWPRSEELVEVVRSALAEAGWDNLKISKPKSDGDEPYADYFSTITAEEPHFAVDVRDHAQ